VRVKGSAEFLEDRRRQALRLLNEGRSLHEVAALIHCAASSVMRWREAWKRGGEEALKVRSSPGRPRKLQPSQRRRLVRLLRKGARAHGYSTDLWTTARIAEVIKRHFAVKYHRDHIGRLMHSLGWTHDQSRRCGVGPDEKSKSEKHIQSPRTGNVQQGWMPASSPAGNRG
jgi:transposase